MEEEKEIKTVENIKKGLEGLKIYMEKFNIKQKIETVVDILNPFLSAKEVVKRMNKRLGEAI
jgi:hypothetical protein